MNGGDIPAGLLTIVGSVVLAVVTGVVGVLFGRNNLRRDVSSAKLAEAQDTQQIGSIHRQTVELERMERRTERDAKIIDDLRAEIQALKDQMAAKQLADSQAAVERMQKQVDKALHAVAPEKIAEVFMASGFYGSDLVLRPAPERRRAPSPSDLFQAADPFSPPVLKDRVADKKP